jgi:formate hydrogenlyase subunit 4
VNGFAAWPAYAALAVLVVAAPGLSGIAVRTKALLTGRRGAPALQPYRDLAKLMRKNAVYSATATRMVRVGPVIGLATLIAAALLLPLDGRAAPIRFAGDLVAFAGLLALGRFALVLAGLDTGSSFEGMGASREVTVSSFAEPVLFLCFVALVVATGGTSLSDMLGTGLASAWPRAAASLVLVALALFVLLLAENSRVPVDDPATHLELTMIHEVIVLDHGGPDLAVVLFGAALKLALFAALIVGVLVPRASLPPWASLPVFALGLAVVAAAVGVVESVMARLRLSRVPQLIVGAGVLALFGIILVLR